MSVVYRTNIITFQEYGSEILVRAAPIYTKPKMEERGVAGRLLVWRKGNWCGSTTTLSYIQFCYNYIVSGGVFFFGKNSQQIKTTGSLVINKAKYHICK